MLTAWGQQSERNRAFKFGVREYLTKPFKLEMLQQEVEKILS
jgi:DNA-binding response OmpR family regulator